MTRRKGILLGCTGVVLIVGIVLLHACLSPWADGWGVGETPRIVAGDPQRTFSSARWKAASSQPASREAMLDDLLSKHNLLGMTQEQVQELLGPSEKPSGKERIALSYRLGKEKGVFVIDDMWLTIEFVDGRAVKVGCYPD